MINLDAIRFFVIGLAAAGVALMLTGHVAPGACDLAFAAAMAVTVKCFEQPSGRG